MKNILAAVVIILLGVWGAYDPIPEICELRTIRMCTALITGASLALAGTLFQAVLRNPLADPYILGISGGASVGVILIYLAGWHTLGFFAVPAGAFTGAIVLFILVLCISRNNNLLLSGVIAGTVAGSILMYLLSIAQVDELAGLTWWMLGDLQSADTRMLLFAGIFLTAATVLLTFSAPLIDALSLGNERAYYLGLSPTTLSILLISVGTLLAANTIALAGIIGFCGLVVPHAARKIFGASHRKMLLPATLWGGAFLMFCDILSRCAPGAAEIPIGVVTSLIGGPLFLVMLNRRKNDHA
jgi:iron complex transport system permease protein